MAATAATLGYYNPEFYAMELLIQLRKSLGLANRVHTGFDAERRSYGKGQLMDIKRPAAYTAQSAPGAIMATATTSVQINLNSYQEVRFALPDYQQAYTGPQFVNDHIAPAAYALADKIDQDIAALIVTVPHVYSEAQSLAATLAGLTGTRQKLFDNKVPLRDEANMHFMIGGKEENDLLSLTAGNFSMFQGSGPVGVATQLSGQIGTRFGMQFFANQNRPSATYANITDFAGATSGTVAKGATSMPVTSLGAAEVYKKGTIIKMTSGTDLGSEYAVTADVTMSSGAGTFVINPPARNAMGSGDTFSIAVTQGEATPNQDVTVGTTFSNNVAFHRNWAALAFARLPEFREFGGLGTNASVVQDPVTGLAVRVLFYYDGANSQMVAITDVLYGVKELDADLACRYEVKSA